MPTERIVHLVAKMSIVSQWVNQHWASICAPTGPGPGSITSGGTEDAERDARRVKQGPCTGHERKNGTMFPLNEMSTLLP